MIKLLIGWKSTKEPRTTPLVAKQLNSACPFPVLFSLISFGKQRVGLPVLKIVMLHVHKSVTSDVISTSSRHGASVKLSQNTRQYDISRVFNFWREIINSGNWCVKQS